MARTFRISGVVTDAKTRKPVPGLRVEAWNADAPAHVVLGSSLTDNRGRFQVAFELTESVFGPNLANLTPDVFLKVFRGSTPIQTTAPVALRKLSAPDTEVRVQVLLDAAQPELKDRVTAVQVTSAVDFFRLSDFRGVWRETRDKATTFGALVGDAVKAKAAKLELKPIKPSDHRTKDVVNQDVMTAQKRLAEQQVTVNPVKSYREAINAQPTGLLRGYPVKLQPGEKVDIYEENGVIRAYSIVKAAPLAADPQTVGRLDTEVRNLRSDVNNLAVLRPDLDQLKASSQSTTTQLAGVVTALKTQVASFEGLKTELATVKAESAQKDTEIANLRQELTTLRNSQNEKISQLEATFRRIRPPGPP